MAPLLLLHVPLEKHDLASTSVAPINITIVHLCLKNGFTFDTECLNLLWHQI